MLVPSEPAGMTNRRDGGFTLVETMVVAALLLVMLGIAGGALISIQKASNSTEARVAEEQAASTALQSVARDIRSAHSLSIPVGAPAADAIELLLNDPSGARPTTTVEWIYNASTLTREVLGSGGTVLSTGPAINVIVNGSKPVFTFFNDQGHDISTSTPAYIADCVTSVGIQVMTTSSQAKVPVFTKDETVTITDQEQILSTPGNGQC